MSEVKNDQSIPQEFLKVMKDFLTDMISTFPEYESSLKKFVVDIVENNDESIRKFHQVFHDFRAH